MTSVVIPRKYWLRGEGAVNSGLFRLQDSKACCLGHALSQILGRPLASFYSNLSPQGVAQDDRNKGLDTLVPEKLLKNFWTSSENVTNSVKCQMLMEINDSQDIDDDEREDGLIKGGVDVDIAFSFVDE